MKHDRLVDSGKEANLSRAAVTEKILSHYDVVSKISLNLHGANVFFLILLDFYKCTMQKKKNFICASCQGELTQQRPLYSSISIRFNKLTNKMGRNRKISDVRHLRIIFKIKN